MILKYLRRSLVFALLVVLITGESVCAFGILPLATVSRGYYKSTFKPSTLDQRRIYLQSDRLILRQSRDEGDGGHLNDIPTSSSDNAIRLNKVFKATHSRREADKLIASGRISVNGKAVESKGGFFVVPYRDEIALDGNIIHGWEKMNAITIQNTASRNQSENSKGQSRQGRKIAGTRMDLEASTEQFEYVKYFKPLGVTCTTDRRVMDNIIDSILYDGLNPRHRIFPVGRLDKETSGLIVLTSDGRMVNAVLRGEKKQPKIYKVKVDGRLEEQDLQRLRSGITIKTVAQRSEGAATTLIAKTKPCKVELIGPCSCQMTLVEGRNRQIRKMMQALGFKVVRLHRIEFMGIQLADISLSKGLIKPGDWAYLDKEEMKLVTRALKAAEEAAIE